MARRGRAARRWSRTELGDATALAAIRNPSSSIDGCLPLPFLPSATTRRGQVSYRSAPKPPRRLGRVAGRPALSAGAPCQSGCDSHVAGRGVAAIGDVAGGPQGPLDLRLPTLSLNALRWNFGHDWGFHGGVVPCAPSRPTQMDKCRIGRSRRVDSSGPRGRIRRRVIRGRSSTSTQGRCEPLRAPRSDIRVTPPRAGPGHSCEERRRPDSNRSKRLCRPLRSHSATAPRAGLG